MPVVLLLLAVVIIAIAIRGHAADAGALLASEFTGPNSFIPAFLAILILGSIGFYKPARPFADGFIGLVILSLFLNKGTGFFTQLESAFQNTAASPAKPIGQTSGSTGATSSGSSSQPQSLQGQLSQFATTVAPYAGI